MHPLFQINNEIETKIIEFYNDNKNKDRLDFYNNMIYRHYTKDEFKNNLVLRILSYCIFIHILKNKNYLSNFLFKNQNEIESYKKNEIKKNSITIQKPLTIVNQIINHYCNEFIDNNNFNIMMLKNILIILLKFEILYSKNFITKINFITNIKEIQKELNIHNIEENFNEFLKIKKRIFHIICVSVA